MEHLWGMQQAVVIAVVIFLVILLVALYIKKRTTKFDDVAYCIKHATHDSAKRYYGKDAADTSICDEGINGDRVKEATLQVLGNWLMTDNHLTHFVWGGIRREVKRYMDENKAYLKGFEIKSAKRIDLGLSDRDVRMEYKILTRYTFGAEEIMGITLELIVDMAYRSDGEIVITEVHNTKKYSEA